jgi:hypothetical protein
MGRILDRAIGSARFPLYVVFRAPGRGIGALPAAGSSEEHSDPVKILCKVSEQRNKLDCFWTDRLLCSLMEGVN